MANFEARVIHKQMYPATYNFKDEADGTEGDDLDFIDAYDETGDPYIKVVALKDGHRKVLEFYNDNVSDNTDLQHIFTAQTSGTIEWWFQYDGGGERFYFQWWDPSDTLTINLALRANDLVYYDLGNNPVAIKTLAPNTWYHFRLDFDCGTDRIDLYIDGTKEVDTGEFRNAVASIDTFYAWARNGDGANYEWIDAYAESWDTGYNIGDNVYHRHYKDQDSDFESEDWGTTSTTIGFIDAEAGDDSTYSVEIVPEFNEHKKVAKFLCAGDNGKYAQWTFNFANQTSGTIEGWVKYIDNGVGFHAIRFYDDTPEMVIFIKFGADDNLCTIFHAATFTSVAAAADTMHHIRIKWDCATDHQWVWLNGVLIVSDVAFYLSRVATTVDVGYIYLDNFAGANSGEFYIDAISYSWTTGNEIGDNWTYNYNPYSYNDDTANVIECVGRVFGYNYRDLYIGFVNSDYDKALHFFQIYDKDGILGFEGDIKIETQDGSYRGYYCISKNKPELEAQQNETFSAAKIYEMLETLTPSTNSRLHLGDYDLDAATYSPTIINLPSITCYQTLGYAGNKVIRIKPNGIVEYHSGTTTGVSITETSSEMSTAPVVKLLQDTFTKVTVYGGGLDPDPTVLTRFSGSAGSGEPEFWKHIPELMSNADCASMATQILLGFATPKKINIQFQDVGAYSAYDTLVFAYSIGDLTITSDTWYILYERLDYATAIGKFVLSNGVLESGEYNLPTHTRDEGVHDNIIRTFADTDVNTVYPVMYPVLGAAEGIYGIQMNAAGEQTISHFCVGSNIDDSRDISITWSWFRHDANADTISGKISIMKVPLDGSATSYIESGTAITLDACAVNRNEKYTYTLDSSDISSDHAYRLWFELNEAREIEVFCVMVTYYIKRSV